MPNKRRSGMGQPSTSWPSTVRVKIDLEKSLFIPSFQCRPPVKSKSAIRCSCSQVSSWNAKDSRIPLTRRFPTECNTPRFVFFDPKKTEKAKELCHSASKHNGTKNFLCKVSVLLRELSKLCEGEKTPDKRRKVGDTNLRPFRNDRLDKSSVSEEIRTKVCLPLNPSEVLDHGLGYIYILRSQNFSTLAELKIGFTKYHPEHRAHELARCMQTAEVIGHTPLLPHAKRLELIIHTELTPLRKVQFCAQCQRHHKEWFTISHIDAREVVTRWSRWILQQPYREGVLTKQWQDYLAAKSFDQTNDEASLEELWSDIIDDYTADNSEVPEEEQISSYINALWLERAHRRSANIIGLQPSKSPQERLQMIKVIRDTHAGGLTLPKSELVPPGPEIFDDELASNGRKLRPDTLQGRDSEREQYLKEGKEFLDQVRSIKTGCMSVSDEKLGSSESPLGDSTLLPVVRLSELDHVDAPAMNWIGYNPTHTGFQYLQEGYRRGDWYGKKPRFKRPGVFRDLEKSRKARRTRHETDVSNSRHGDEQADPASVEMDGHQKPPQVDRLADSASSRSDTHEGNGQVEVKWIPGKRGEGSVLQFSQEMTPDLLDRCNTLHERILNGGRAEIERELRKSLAYFGVDECAPDSDEESSSDDESDYSSEGEGPKQAVDMPSFEDKRSHDQIKDASTGLSEGAAKKWLGAPHEPTTPVEYTVMCGNPSLGGYGYSFSCVEQAPASLCNKPDPTGLSSESDATSQFLRSVVFRHHDRLLKSRDWRCEICGKPAQELLHQAVPVLNPGIGASPDFKPVICDFAIPVCRLAGDCDDTAEKRAQQFLKECFPMYRAEQQSCDTCEMMRKVKSCGGCRVLK